MAEDFSSMMNEAFDAAAGDTAPATPAPASETPPVETTSTPLPETPAEAGEAEFLGDKFDWSKVPPEQLPALKGFQADYTRKMQQIAEQRKALEAVDPAMLNFAQTVQQVAQTNPALARELLLQQAQQLGGAAPPAAAPDPYAQVLQSEFVSEDTKLIARELQQVKALVAQQEQARAQEHINRRFAETESQYSQKIPEDERRKVCQYCLANQIPDVGLGWKLMNFDRVRQMGIDEGSRVLQQKAAMGAPTNGVAARAETAPHEPRTVREAIEMGLALSETG